MRKFLGHGRLITSGEAIAVGLGAMLLALVFDQVNAFERFAAFLAGHEAWQLDELFFVSFFGGGAALLIAVRRGHDLSREMARRARAEARALTLARHDPLTGLANRRLLGADLPALLRLAGEGGQACSVLCIDLDGFKPINDVQGHEAGDMVLVEVARRLRATCPHGLVARVGGDEFVVALAHAPGTDAAAQAAVQVIRAIGVPWLVMERKVEIGASVGIACSPGNGSDAEALIRAADIAMYEAKRAGRGTYRFFDAEMDERLRARAALEADLRDAVAAGEIVPYFQPVISLSANRVIGFEALARWQHPRHGAMSPDTFIPIAEDLGLIDELCGQILRAGCIAAKSWGDDVSLSINISPMQLKDSWLASRLMAILTDNGMAPQRLIVEVTENAIIDDIDMAATVFASLQNAGIRIALDDFGKGYSSLSHLRQLHFNHLKIDSSFVRSMDTAESRKIVQAVAGLGKALGMPVTAEGVETEGAAAALRAIGCEQAQGYWFGRPVPALDTTQLGAVRPRRSRGTKRAA